MKRKRGRKEKRRNSLRRSIKKSMWLSKVKEQCPPILNRVLGLWRRLKSWSLKEKDSILRVRISANPHSTSLRYIKESLILVERKSKR